MMEMGHYKILLLLSTATLPYSILSCRPEGRPERTDSPACSSKTLLIARSGDPSFSISHLDAFVYFTDGACRLDSYNHYESDESRQLEVTSTYGTRHIVLTANVGGDIFSYEDVLSYESIGNVVCDLAGEDPSRPYMSGETTCLAGSESERRIVLRPLMAKVRVNSLNVDFSGRPYRNRTLNNIKAYLINVRGSCALVPDADSGDGGVIYNYGGFNEWDTGKLSHPEMLYCDDATGHPMYCYPNPLPEEGPALGRGVTRLVIEGVMDGVTYYYPIGIGENGVARGGCYTYDITLTRTGTLDPDTPVDTSMARVSARSIEWHEYENETIIY